MSWASWIKTDALNRGQELSNGHAQTVRNSLVTQLKTGGLDSEQAFFALVRCEVEKLSGHVLNAQPAIFEDGWLVSFAVFDDGEYPEFLFAMSHYGQGIFGIALDSDPSCPEWLQEFAQQMYLIQQS